MSPSSLKEIEDQIDETSEISEQYLNGKIRQFALHWGLTFLLYLSLWNLVTWVKWTLLITVPLALLALWQILYTKHRLGRKVDEIRQAIHHIEQIEGK